MRKINVQIPDNVEVRIKEMVDDGEFSSFEEATRQLISSGLTAYQTDNADEDEFSSGFDDIDSTHQNHEDEYIF